MQLKEVIGQQEVKSRLIRSIADGRVAHTQLFLGPEGSGTLAMAIAYAQFINCKYRSNEDSCGICPSCVKFQKYSHPDLHFYFPNNTNDKVKKDPESKLFLSEWREYLNQSKSYAIGNEWYNMLGVGNKQGNINVRDAGEIVGKMSMRAYEAKYKVIIIYLAEKLNPGASNKLLKTLEEPPSNTLILLIAERYELIIPTVRSRTQLIKFNKIKDIDIEVALNNMAIEGLDSKNLKNFVWQAKGNWNEVLNLIKNKEGANDYFIKFRQWLRFCFMPKNYVELFAFNQELSRLGREKQKSFLNYGLSVIHNSIMMNSNNSQSVKTDGEELDFTKSFAPFINEVNRLEIYNLLNEAIYHIERNAHPGILFTDLSLKLVKQLYLGKAKMKT